MTKLIFPLNRGHLYIYANSVYQVFIPLYICISVQYIYTLHIYCAFFTTQESLIHHKFYVDADEEQSWINEKVQLLAAIDALPTDLSSALLMSRKLQVCAITYISANSFDPHTRLYPSYFL